MNASTADTASGGRIGACSAVSLPPFVVADGWIAYHHVTPSVMRRLQEALLAAHAHDSMSSMLMPSSRGRGAAATNRSHSTLKLGQSCAGLLAWHHWANGAAVHRCQGELCPASDV